MLPSCGRRGYSGCRARGRDERRRKGRAAAGWGIEQTSASPLMRTPGHKGVHLEQHSVDGNDACVHAADPRACGGEEGLGRRGREEGRVAPAAERQVPLCVPPCKTPRQQARRPAPLPPAGVNAARWRPDCRQGGRREGAVKGAAGASVAALARWQHRQQHYTSGLRSAQRRRSTSEDAVAHLGSAIHLRECERGCGRGQ